MNLRILVMLLCTAGCYTCLAQTSNNKAYAITSKTNGGFEWTEVKQINLANGEVVRDVFGNKNAGYNVFDARSARPLTISKNTDSTKENQLHPFAGLSAACAYDAKRNRLYYAPLFLNQLRYIDLNQEIPAVYLFNEEKLSNATDIEAEAFHITRMAIASDGNGYAMSNNGMHLVRFTTDKNPVITDLGSLHDVPENGEVSIHNANTSWGGDMLGDASGHLYVISALNHVFKINVQTRSATFISKIKNLPVGFTTNGAVVDEEGNIVLSSANFLTSYYNVDPHTWEAAAVQATDQVYNTSDLANEKLLFQTKLATDNNVFRNEKISIYPNPVKANMFRVSFENKEAGKYNVQLADVTGRIVSDRALTVFNGSQVSEIRVNGSLTKGMYFVKVLNHKNREVFTGKVILE